MPDYEDQCKKNQGAMAWTWALAKPFFWQQLQRHGEGISYAVV
jgi:hypothetical protein